MSEKIELREDGLTEQGRALMSDAEYKAYIEERNKLIDIAKQPASQQQAPSPSTPSADRIRELAIAEIQNRGLRIARALNASGPDSPSSSNLVALLECFGATFVAEIAATPQQVAPQHGGLVPQGGSAGGVTDAEVERAMVTHDMENANLPLKRRSTFHGMRAALESFAASRLDAATPAPCVDSGERAGIERIERIVAGKYFYHKAKGTKMTPILSQILDEIAKEKAALAASPSHGTGAV